MVCGVTAQFKPASWRNLLSGGPNNVYGKGVWDGDSLFILDGVLHGFKVVDPGADISPYYTPNYASAIDKSGEQMNIIIQDELLSGKLSIVKEKPQCVHALGAVPKPNGSIRPITDASRPKFMSINNYMNQTFNHFKYNSMDDVCAFLKPNCYLSVSDISAAYRSVLTRAHDRKFQGLKWGADEKDEFMVDNFLSFGARASAFIFNRLTDSVSRYINACGYICINYLDDFLIMGQSYKECQSGQLLLHETLRSLGFYIAYNKVSSPSRVQIYLGIEIDTINMKLRLPKGKLQKLHTELSFFNGRTKATRKQLQRLCGVLSHCTTVVKGGRTFSRRVIDLLCDFSDNKRYINLNQSFFSDLEWWQSFANWFNGEARVLDGQSHPSRTLTSDASDSGWGILCGDDWAAGLWQSDIVISSDSHHHCVAPTKSVDKTHHISVRELYPILEALDRWGPIWKNCRVTCETDNTQVVSAVNSGRTSNLKAMTILREIFWKTVIWNCQLVAVHLPGVLNHRADYLSRLSNKMSFIPDFDVCCSGGIVEVFPG